MEISRTQGKRVVIDDEDWELIRDYTWYAARYKHGWYAVANARAPEARKEGKIFLHRLLIGARPGEMVDHRDLDTLNCRRGNLRLCTNAQNQQNTRSRRGSSRFKGVSWGSSKKQWRVAFRCDGRRLEVGYFLGEEEAARAYDAAVPPLAGEFDRLNFPAAA